jgi:hypothetical protein
MELELTVADVLSSVCERDQLSCVLSVLRRVHLSGDDLAAEDVDDEVQVEEHPEDRRLEVRDVPAPDLVRVGRDQLVRTAPRRRLRCGTVG